MFFILFFYLPVKLKIKIFVSGIVLFIVFFATDFLFSLNITQNIIGRFNNNSSLEWRFEVWNYLLYGISKGNIFIGQGIESARYFLIPYMGGVSMPHNLYLQMFYEYGLCSVFYFLPYIILGIKFLKASFSKKIENRLFYVVPFLIISEIIIDMFISNSVLLRSTMYFGWVIIAIFYLQLNSELKDLKNLK